MQIDTVLVSQVSFQYGLCREAVAVRRSPEASPAGRVDDQPGRQRLDLGNPQRHALALTKRRVPLANQKWFWDGGRVPISAKMI